MSALFLGMVLALEYDCIRIFRRVIRHKNIWVMSAEDILYWIYAAVTVFCMTYEVNDGIAIFVVIVEMVLPHRSRRESNLRKTPLSDNVWQGRFYTGMHLAHLL